MREEVGFIFGGHESITWSQRVVSPVSRYCYGLSEETPSLLTNYPLIACCTLEKEGQAGHEIELKIGEGYGERINRECQATK